MKKTILKKLTSVVLMLVMVLSMGASLTACGEKDDGKLHISFYHSMGSGLRGVLRDYVNKFEEMYPNVKIDGVDETAGGDYDAVRDVISTELTAGNHPDIAYCYPDHVALYNIAGAVQPLDDLISSTETVNAMINGVETPVQIGLTAAEKADYVQGYYNEGNQFADGKMYTLPFSKSTEVLFYNKTYFDAHKDEIEVPTHWTCSDYTEGHENCKSSVDYVCGKILEIEARKDGYKPGSIIPLGYDSESNWFITMAEQYGSPYTSAESGAHFKFDNAANHKFVKMITTWYAKGYITTKALDGGYSSDRFKKLTTYMCIGSTGGATYQTPNNTDGVYDFEAGVAPIPQVDASNPKAISQGPNVCIFKNSDPEKVKYSWLLIKYLTTNPEFQARFAVINGYLPVTYSAAQDSRYQAALATADGHGGLAMLSSKVAIDTIDSAFVSPAFYGSSVARDQVGLLIQNVLSASADKNGNLLGDAALNELIANKFADAIANCREESGSN